MTNSKTRPETLITFRGLNLYSLESAIVNSTPALYRNSPLNIQIALKNSNFDALAETLIRSGNVALAGRIIGAFEILGMRAESEKLKAIMSGAGFEGIKSVDSFDKLPIDKLPIQFGKMLKEAARSTRVRVMWQKMRQSILDIFNEQNPEFDFLPKAD